MEISKPNISYINLGLIIKALYSVINAEANNHTNRLSNILRTNRSFPINVGSFEGFEGLKIAEGTPVINYQSW